MMIIDSQVHAYEANTPKRPWHSVPNWPPHVTGDEMVAAMDRVGVDGSIFISAFSLYQYDASYAVEVQRKHPGRFAIIKPVNPADPAVGEVIAEWKKQPGAVAVRIAVTTREAGLRPDDQESTHRARSRAAGFPVNAAVLGNLEAGAARRRHRIPASSSHMAIQRRARRPHRPNLGRPAESTRLAKRQRADQGERRLHPFPQALSVPRHLGSIRRLIDAWGDAASGARLDACLRDGELRAGTLRTDRLSKRASHADGAPARGHGWSPQGLESKLHRLPVAREPR
jgi:hypothetical protein